MDKDFGKYYKITDKEFWRNYWFYYRVHTLVGIAVLIVVIMTAVSILTQVKPDITMMHIGGGLFSENAVTQVENSVAETIPDINGDGKQVVSFQSMLFQQEADPELSYAVMTKADMEFIGGESTLVLVDESIMQRYIDMDVFADLTEYVPEGTAPELLKYSEDGSQILLVNVMNTELIRQSGYQGPDLYLGLRVLPHNMEDKDDMVQRAEVSTQILRELLAQVQ